ncbi:MAG TPA: SDR family oxidoreductase [Mycobacteriales bacterium]|nr:SDR family oxidoreductase [Mycobacteriales bacterium]
MARTVVVLGGTAGIGLEIARHYAAGGDRVVISGRDAQRAEGIAKEIGDAVSGIGLDLAEPAQIAERLSGVDRIDYLVLAAVERDANTLAGYDIARAIRLVTLKLVGYTEAVRVAVPKMPPDGAVVLFGGLAKERPYPGSTTVTTVNGGIDSMVRTLAVQLAPIRVNALHPGVVPDSPQWIDKPEATERVLSRTPGRRSITMADMVDAVAFLLRNQSVNGINLHVDGGWLLT